MPRLDLTATPLTSQVASAPYPKAALYSIPILCCLRTSLRSSSLFIRASMVSLSSIPVIRTKASKFATVRGFVRPSTAIFFVGTQRRWIVFRYTSCLSQWEWISTWRSLVWSFVDSSTKSRIVWALLYSTVRASGMDNVRAFIKRER